MATPLTPSKIVKLQEVFGAALRKSDPPDSEAQNLIEKHWHELKPELMTAFTAAVNRVLEHMRNTISVEVEVDYDRSPREMLNALGRCQHVDPDVVAQIPRRGTGKKRVVFRFKRLLHNATNKEIERIRTADKLLQDVYAQAAVNMADSSFAARCQNVAVFVDDESQWCYLACDQVGEECSVVVGRRDREWVSGWWIGGICDESAQAEVTK